jgi:hypothetical protein
MCTATYTFDQDSLEAGPRVFTANFSTGSELGAPLVPASVTVTPQLAPALTAAIAESTCVKPTKAGTFLDAAHPSFDYSSCRSDQSK